MRLATILLAIALGGIAATPALAHEEKLAGGEWVLSGTGGRHAPVLRFEAGRVGGSGGCNRFGGRYELTGDKLTLSPLATTRMACPPEIMTREQAFLALLAAVRGATIDGDRLDLRDGDGKVIATLTRRVAD